ncbi:DUF1433 domain-containing protein [Bacillus toyonensis]|uniref:DUF1433 domain-containing protein n=1 Tax=Bacillus toyonensis TaxID=155322 RepID=UPI003D1CEA2F
MKKTVMVVFLIILIIAGGYMGMKYVDKKEQEEQFWKKQEIRIEKYIRYNIKNVQSITFTKREVSPMGIPAVYGYINDDKELDFIASISTTKNFENKFTCSGELYDNYVKKPEKSVSEIEKEEKEKRQE